MNLTHDSGPWADAVKAEIAVSGAARIWPERQSKRRVVRPSRKAAITPKNMVLFVGQGVKHPTFGYGAIHQLVAPGKVRVKFRAGVETVPTSSLGTAAIHVVDVLAERRAKCFPYPTIKAKKAAEVAERKAARAAKNFPYPTAKAKKAAEVAARKAARAAKNFPYATAKAKKAAERQARRVARIPSSAYSGQYNSQIMAVSR